jgi:hypothetical protein
VATVTDDDRETTFTGPGAYTPSTNEKSCDVAVILARERRVSGTSS